MQHASTRIRFLKQLRARVPHGAPLLVSVFARREAIRYLRIVVRTANVLRVIRGHQKAELGDDLVPNFVHHFSEDELAAELEAGGFRLAEFSRVGSPHAVARAVGALDDPSVRGSAPGEERAESLWGQVTTELLRDAAKGRALRAPHQAHVAYTPYATAAERAKAATFIAKGSIRKTYDQWRTAVGAHVLRIDLSAAPRAL
jgi:hypothetical protein